VAVFLDYQNVYMRARELFAEPHAHFTAGQIFPRRLGVLVTQRGSDVDPHRQLEVVRVFRGEPSPKHSPTGQAACQRQVHFWASQMLVQTITRPLHYYQAGYRNGVEQFKAREKGIDVLIALSIALGAERDEYDVCVLFSADTDLLPALEQARAAGKRVEVAAWKPDVGYASHLSPRCVVPLPRPCRLRTRCRSHGLHPGPWYIAVIQSLRSSPNLTRSRPTALVEIVSRRANATTPASLRAQG
jgi:hypothetical protein